MSVRRLLSLSVAPSRFYGRADPVVAGARVTLQRLSGGRWNVIARTTTGRHGWYMFTRQAAGTYRTAVAATTSYAKGFSAETAAG